MLVKRENWTPPVLETDVFVLMKILQSSASIKHIYPNLFEATLEETIRNFFIRINCISDEGTSLNSKT